MIEMIIWFACGLGPFWVPPLCTSTKKEGGQKVSKFLCQLRALSCNLSTTKCVCVCVCFQMNVTAMEPKVLFLSDQHHKYYGKSPYNEVLVPGSYIGQSTSYGFKVISNCEKVSVYSLFFCSYICSIVLLSAQTTTVATNLFFSDLSEVTPNSPIILLFFFHPRKKKKVM